MSATARLWVGVAIACFASGCYWSSPPSTPHRSVKVDLASTPAFRDPSPRPIESKRVVVLGRFDTTAPNPIGGLYDRKDYRVSPLIRTYFYKDGAVEVFEHVSDGLRAAGLMVLKDYAGHAEPALLEAPLREMRPLLVTATVLSLQHDQIRDKTDDGKHAEWEAARIELAVKVTEADGSARLAKKYVVAGRVPHNPTVDLLKVLGWTVADQLASDPEFLKAIEATSRGAS
jgi:hypothetical protein